MKKKLLSIIILCLFCACAINAKTFRVGKLQTIKSIQKAIDVAKNGDTILVDAGLYKEKNIVIQKSITLIGLNYPVLDGEKKYQNSSLGFSQTLLILVKAEIILHLKMEVIETRTHNY